MNSRNFLNRSKPPSIFTLVVIASISVLSMNMLLPALPSMTDYFETNYSVMQLTVTGYLAMTGLLQIIFGPLSDRYGRRPIILIGLTIFILASFICMFAPNIEIFLLGRILQTSAATGIVLSRAIVKDLYRTDEAASMLGYVTVGMMVVPMFSPLIGGVLDQYFGWQAIFAAMIAFAGICLVVVYFDLGETNKNKSSSFSEQIKGYPELLKSRRFWGYTLTATFTSGAYFALLGGGPFVATEHFHLNPTEFGSFFLFIATGYLIGNFASGRYSTRMGINKMMVLGGIISCIGLTISVTIILLGHASAISFFGSMFFVGVGNGLTLPNANAGMVSIKPKLAGSASGLGGAVMIGGGAAIAAYVTSILTIESGPLPLVGFMLITSVLALLNTCYVIFVEARSTNKIN